MASKGDAQPAQSRHRGMRGQSRQRLRMAGRMLGGKGQLIAYLGKDGGLRSPDSKKKADRKDARSAWCAIRRKPKATSFWPSFSSWRLSSWLFLPFRSPYKKKP